MQLIRKILFFSILIALLSNCIEPFNTNIEIQNVSKFVVFGQLSDQEGYQTISISISTSIDKPVYTPITDCTVQIIDDLGNSYNLTESTKGNYQVWMDKEDLKPGISYKANIITPTGVEIVSDFEQMPECPEVDSVYYLRADMPTSDPLKPLQGVQFYIDVDAGITESKFYRWDIIETWEHHAAQPLIWFWNRSAIIRVNPPDYSRFYCWTTEKINSIYTLSTEDLSQNQFKMFKLHFVDNLTQRLTYCYSINVLQYSLTKSAHEYWNKLRKNNNENGGLYDAQPMHVKGNLRSTSNPELEILGFFTASPFRQKRIFARDIENLDLFYIECDGREIMRGDLNKTRDRYLTEGEGGGLLLLEEACIECMATSGTTTRPLFWPY